MADDAAGEIRRAYSAGAAAWASGPEAVYAVLAEALVGESPLELAGKRVLDLGSGTGVATRALLGRGADPIGFDLSWAMLAHRRAERPPGVVGDAGRPPFAPSSFDAVVAACCINHFEPEEPLRRLRASLRPGGALVASSFPSARPHPAKAVIEEVLAERGWHPPSWYAEFRTRIAAVTGDPAALSGAAARAGFADVEAYVVDVEAGVDDVDRLLAWRLSMPHTIGFVESLGDGEREALVGAIRSALEGPVPGTIPLLVLRGVTP